MNLNDSSGEQVVESLQRVKENRIILTVVARKHGCDLSLLPR